MELAVILGEAYSTVHRVLTGLLADGIAARVNHGTVHLPSSGRWFLTSEGIGEASDALGYETPSEFVRAYPVSQQWLTLLLRRMDAVASVYRLAMALSPGYSSRRTRVEFHRRGRFDATITLDDGRTFGVVRQGLGLRRRSLYERLRALAEWDFPPPRHDPGPGAERVGAAADGAAVRARAPRVLLRRRGVARCAGERDRPPVARADVGVRGRLPHAP